MKLTDLAVIFGGVFALLEWQKPGHGILGNLLGSGGGGPALLAGGLTYQQACDAARAGLVQLGGDSWKTVTCEQIKQHLKNDPTLWSPNDPIRKGLGL